MSDDLISRKQAIKAVKTIIQAGLPEEAIYAELEEIPKAYGVDDVRKELERMKQIMLSPTNIDCFGDQCRESDCMACVLNRSIEIVRNGGKK